jgi:hypothetical protein
MRTKSILIQTSILDQHELHDSSRTSELFGISPAAYAKWERDFSVEFMGSDEKTPQDALINRLINGKLPGGILLTLASSAASNCVRTEAEKIRTVVIMAMGNFDTAKAMLKLAGYTDCPELDNTLGKICESYQEWENNEEDDEE